MDVNEQKIERPKKQKQHYSIKKKHHTQKAQVIAVQKTYKIVATAFSNGSKYDFQLFRDDGGDFVQVLHILADAGWQNSMKPAGRRSRNRNLMI